MTGTTFYKKNELIELREQIVDFVTSKTLEIKSNIDDHKIFIAFFLAKVVLIHQLVVL